MKHPDGRTQMNFDDDYDDDKQEYTINVDESFDKETLLEIIQYQEGELDNLRDQIVILEQIIQNKNIFKQRQKKDTFGAN